MGLCYGFLKTVVLVGELCLGVIYLLSLCVETPFDRKMLIPGAGNISLICSSTISIIGNA